MNKSDQAKSIISELLEQMKSEELRAFVGFVIQRAPNYYTSPGSRKHHHAFEGGLAFHSATAAKLGKQIADHYNNLGIQVNRDLVVAGILLHDIGKIYCYEWKDEYEERKGIDLTKIEAGYHHTQNGTMLHHIPMGFSLVKELAQEYNHAISIDPILNQETLTKLLHIILSHHGRRAWSSPVIPQFTEAYIVHAVEMMDGYVDKFNEGKSVDTIYDGVNY